MTDRSPTPQAPWHALDAATVVACLEGNAAGGLSAEAVRERAARYGPNALPEPPKRPAFMVFLQQFRSPLIYILFIAAALAGALGNLDDGAVILAVVMVNALIGTYQERRAERSMAALRRLSTLHVRVLRDGREQDIEARDLVPGDVLLLAAGDAIGADARLIEPECA